MKKLLHLAATLAAFFIGAVLSVAIQTRADISPLGGVSLPAGAVIAYAGSGVPAGFTACDSAGETVSRTSALGVALAGLWGAGDGSSTYTKPNFARYTLVGANGTGTATLAATVGSTGGAETVTITTANLPASGLSVPGLSVPSLSVTGSLSSLSALNPVAGSGATLTGIDRRVVDGSTEIFSGSTALSFGASSISGSTGTGTTGTGTTGNMGSGTAMTLMQPSAVVRLLCKT